MNNLVGTLARVAIGAMVARGVGKMMRGGSSQQAPSSGGGLGGLLGGLTGGGSSTSSGGIGGLGGMLGGMLGGSSGASAGQAQGQGQTSGGLGGLLDSLGGGSGGTQAAGGGLGGLLNQALGGQAVQPTAEQNSEAEILLRAMINAAKSDGQVDQDEQQKILEHMGDAAQEDVQFVRDEMAAPLDVDAFVRSVPPGLQQKAYLMSLLAIDLDSRAEAQYLDRLAKGFGMAPEAVNQIHAQVGVPALYT